MMAPRNNNPDDPHHHEGTCRKKVSDREYLCPSSLFWEPRLPAYAYISLQHRKGHWCWTDAEIESLKHQAGVLHLEWPSIAKVSLLEFNLTIRIPSQNGKTW